SSIPLSCTRSADSLVYGWPSLKMVVLKVAPHPRASWADYRGHAVGGAGALRALAPHLRRTLTWDQGKELDWATELLSRAIASANIAGATRGWRLTASAIGP